MDWFLGLYLLGGVADYHSTQAMLARGGKETSAYGPKVGPVVSAAAFAAADISLKKHKGWRWVLRGGYVVFISTVVIHNNKVMVVNKTR